MKKILILLFVVSLLLFGCGSPKTDTSTLSDPVEYSFSELSELKDNFWDMWIEETQDLSEAEFYGTSDDKEEQNEHYFKIAAEYTKKIAESAPDIPIGKKIIVTGYLGDVKERNESGFFVRQGVGKYVFYLKHNESDDEYSGFICATDDDRFSEIEKNSPIKIEAIFIEPNLSGSNDDLYDCQIISE